MHRWQWRGRCNYWTSKQVAAGRKWSRRCSCIGSGPDPYGLASSSITARASAARLRRTLSVSRSTGMDVRHSVRVTMRARQASQRTWDVIAPHLGHSAINSATTARVSIRRENASASIG